MSLASRAENKVTIARLDGALIGLVALLSKGSMLAKENAAGALRDLAMNTANHVTIARLDCEEPLPNRIEVTISSVVPRGDRLRVSTSVVTAEIAADMASQIDLTPGSRVIVSFAPEAARLVPVAAE